MHSRPSTIYIKHQLKNYSEYGKLVIKWNFSSAKKVGRSIFQNALSLFSFLFKKICQVSREKMKIIIFCWCFTSGNINVQWRCLQNMCPLQCLHLGQALVLGTHPSKGITLLGSPNSRAPP
jgi:hypothetical protein